jgi:hypothetical protein
VKLWEFLVHWWCFTRRLNEQQRAARDFIRLWWAAMSLIPLYESVDADGDAFIEGIRRDNGARVGFHLPRVECQGNPSAWWVITGGGENPLEFDHCDQGTGLPSQADISRMANRANLAPARAEAS